MCDVRSMMQQGHPCGRSGSDRVSGPAVIIFESSPRGRGEHLLLARDGAGEKDHPRSARRTSRRCQPLCCGQDHTRGRGEHGQLKNFPAGEWGSSPRARGALPRTQSTRMLSRIIPAGAGSTGYPASGRGAAADHPRGRGEHRRPESRDSASRGSSPRAQGAHTLDRAPADLRGIIPAGAGSTCAAPCSRASPTDHPRGRGEHTQNAAKDIFDLGSSPRARGAHFLTWSSATGSAVFHSVRFRAAAAQADYFGLNLRRAVRRRHTVLSGRRAPAAGELSLGLGEGRFTGM